MTARTPMRPRLRRVAFLASSVALALAVSPAPWPAPCRADDPPSADDDPGDMDDPAPPPGMASSSGSGLSPADEAKAKAAFDEALALVEKHSYERSRKKFRDFLEKWPGAPKKMRTEAEERSAENCFLGVEEVHHGGPPENRVDFELMGDGYLLAKIEQFRKHADDQMKAFWAEPLYDEYQSYLNVWRFDLVSKEEGVDEADRGPPGGQAPDPRKRQKKRPLKEYSTALNCVAAGPQNQVCADPEMVFKWRKYLRDPEGRYTGDGQSICFAKKGSLGMGGGGIATTGRLVAVVHEVGHAFIGLLDEYANHPGSPPGRISALNAVSGRGPKEEPDPKAVPWKHWIEAKNAEVGLFLGGATYQEGVYRPAASCAMNSGGASPLCWVCREAGVLKIYEYVNPIDDYGPSRDAVRMVKGIVQEFWVEPMSPKSHKLTTDWFLERLPAVTPGEGGPSMDGTPRPTLEDPGDSLFEPGGRYGGGARGRERMSKPWPETPPVGERIKDVRSKSERGGYRSTAALPDIGPGRYRLTAVVKDAAKLDDSRYHGFAWVIRDPYRLLEERRTWSIEVRETDGTSVPR